MSHAKQSKRRALQGSEGAQYKHREEFLRIFNDIARHKHRYDVFKDFVTMAAITLHNRVCKAESLEAEYLAIAKRYTKEEMLAHSHLLAILVNLLEPAPLDQLGQLYMALNLGSDHVGQFFTPDHISQLMAMMTIPEALSAEALANKPFITLCEPACGAGGMVLAAAKTLIDSGHNPAHKMWAYCQDIDRTAAMMCYIQLSLWHIPASINVGDTLKGEVLETFYTPAHYLEGWTHRLQWRSAIEKVKAVFSAESQNDAQTNTQASQPTVVAEPIPNNQQNLGEAMQFDFKF